MTRVLGAFRAGALGLAGLGIFGVMTYMVTRRTREIGIRIALGAAGFTRLLRTALFEVSLLEPEIYVWVVLVLGGTAMLAAWLPARRALRVDPVEALSEEGETRPFEEVACMAAGRVRLGDRQIYIDSYT